MLVASCGAGLRLAFGAGRLLRPGSLVRHVQREQARTRLLTSHRLLQAARAAPMTTDAKASGVESGSATVNRLAKEESPYLLQHQHNPVSLLHLLPHCHCCFGNYVRPTAAFAGSMHQLESPASVRPNKL